MLSKFIYLNSIRGNIHCLDPALYLLISIYWNGLPSLRSLRCFLLSLRSHQVIVAVTNDIRVPVVFHLLEWTAVFTESEMLPPLIESIKGIVAVTNDIRVPVVDCCVLFAGFGQPILLKSSCLKCTGQAVCLIQVPNCDGFASSTDSFTSMRW